MKQLSIVIVTWNCKKFVDECLESLAGWTSAVGAEIIVVDNASQDGTPDLVSESYPEVRLVRSNENLGFPRGNNVGINMSSGKYVCLINPDVRVLPGCIEKMMAYMEANPQVGLLGPRMLDGDGNSHRSYMGAPSLWNLLCRALALDMLFPKSKLFSGFLMFYFDRSRTAEVDVVNGWFWMTRKTAIEEVGLMDETLFMYADDLDWSKRFRDGGWKVVYLPEAESIHYGGGTTARAPVRFAVEMQRANFQYWRKNHGELSQWAYLGILLFHNAVRVVGYSIRGLLPGANQDDTRFKVKRSLACIQWCLGVGEHGRVTAQTEVRAEAASL